MAAAAGKKFRNSAGSVPTWEKRFCCEKKFQFQKSARSVPVWEKRFCWEVGRLPWKRLVEAKKYNSYMHNVLHWDDSASKEAFDRAKLRYWMKINGRPIKIPLPSPDIYIDKVDWNPNNNKESELLEDLDEASCAYAEEEKVIINSIDVPFDQLKPTGWDVIDVAFDQIEPTGWDVDDHYPKNFDQRNNRFILTGMLVGED